MPNSTTWVGMDVHKESILAVAIAGDSGAVMARWETPNTAKGMGRLATRLAGLGTPRCVYEAGPCGYDLRRFLDGKGIPCEVIAPSLIPAKPGDRVKTDRRDAEKLARMHRMGELTAIHVPTPAQEALRDLVRAREDANEDLVRARHRLQKFLLRQGRRFEGKPWSRDHWRWIRALSFDDPNAQTVLAEYLAAVDQQLERVARLDARIEEEAQQPAMAPAVARLKTLRGVRTLTAMTILSELIDLKRFASPRELMAFIGLVPSEYSSGGKQRRGSLTRAGNAHVRRVLVEAAWHYRHPPHRTGETIRKRREGQSPEVIETARKAEVRLYRKFTRMVMRGKRTTVAAVAVARELAGFVWATGRI
jgi:transposase